MKVYFLNYVLKRAGKVAILCPMCEKNALGAGKVAILCPRCQAWEGLFPLHTTLKRIASQKGLFLLEEVGLAGEAGVEWSALFV